MKTRILFVEDDASLLDLLIDAANMEGYYVEGVSSGEAAINLLSQKAFDIVVTDVTMPGISGLDLLPLCQQLCPGIHPIVITAHGTIEIAIEAMKRGAADFLCKPFEYETLSSTMRVAAQHVARARSGKDTNASTIVAASPVMRALLGQASSLAQFNTTILVTGETGTGKELVARAIHRQSPRHNRAFVALNCTAIPEQLLEDELFGHVKGAFTGAQAARDGRFEQANGGTLFLDEIGDMSLPLQSKLLRVLQEREFEKLGSSRTIKVDVRIVAATSARLESKIGDGSFRPDLFYRLNVAHLHLPPLRERPEDIKPLSEELLGRFCSSAGLPVKMLDGAALEALSSYNWPGNVRQLQNALERAAALSGARQIIYPGDLPEEVRGCVLENLTHTPLQLPPIETSMTDEGLSFDAVVTKVEHELLLQSLNKAGGNKMRAAKLLNMKRTTFLEKLKRLKIETDEE
jgi:two-component system, NtrC family, response regulator AtoC